MLQLSGVLVPQPPASTAPIPPAPTSSAFALNGVRLPLRPESLRLPTTNRPGRSQNLRKGHVGFSLSSRRDPAPAPGLASWSLRNHSPCQGLAQQGTPFSASFPPLFPPQQAQTQDIRNPGARSPSPAPQPHPASLASAATLPADAHPAAAGASGSNAAVVRRHLASTRLAEAYSPGILPCAPHVKANTPSADSSSSSSSAASSGTRQSITPPIPLQHLRSTLRAPALMSASPEMALDQSSSAATNEQASKNDAPGRSTGAAAAASASPTPHPPPSSQPPSSSPSSPHQRQGTSAGVRWSSEHPPNGLLFQPLPDRKPGLHIPMPRNGTSLGPQAEKCAEGEGEGNMGASTRSSSTAATGLAQGVAREGSAEKEQLPPDVDPRRLPRHVAMILDGNSRWAKRRGLPKEMGHEAGVRALKRAVRLTGDWGIQALTVFAFSTENWKRPKPEVDFLMALLERMMQDDVDELHREGVVVRVMGDMSRLAEALQEKIKETWEVTQGNKGLKLTIAVNYSGRQDIVAACRSLASRVAEGEISSRDIDEALFDASLGTAWLGKELASPDVLIRTSGEQRLSNFLLWQTAYTELVFSRCLWPDFSREEYRACLVEYQQRERRFGGRDERNGCSSKVSLEE